MLNKKLLFFFLLLIIGVNAFPAVFVVTSNADSGPGTLRDALTQAAVADSTVINYINFNLPDLSAAGRTIIILSQLPDVSSNLIIDGTTQTGNVFGVSTAKVALFFQTPVNQTLSGLRIVNKHDVAILGLYIKVSAGLTYTDIANAFTPNGDGINDYWKINGIESYPDAMIQVFTRYGQQIFESKGYSNFFDGTYNGIKLPAGVYYYVINLNTSCNLIAGSLTIIR